VIRCGCAAHARAGKLPVPARRARHRPAAEVSVAARSSPYFTPATFKFLRGLARNNRRDWFEAHRAEYEEHVKGAALRLIADLGAPLRSVSRQLVADPRPVGGSLFRIYRDVRFSKDKSPYKTHLGISFYHAATKATARGLAGNAALGRLDAPVLYLHVEPGGCFTGGGIWHPQPPTLKRLREFMIDNPRSWQKLTRARSFTRYYELGGESLSRPPHGIPINHPLIEDLKRKDIVASAELSEAEITGRGLPAALTRRFRAMRPLLEWLCLALELDF
jgi:uncharacterized protein (TIGR02453 family)